MALSSACYLGSRADSSRSKGSCYWQVAPLQSTAVEDGRSHLPWGGSFALGTVQGRSQVRLSRSLSVSCATFGDGSDFPIFRPHVTAWAKGPIQTGLRGIQP